jgi:hypothetical protein
VRHAIVQTPSPKKGTSNQTTPGQARKQSEGGKNSTRTSAWAAVVELIADIMVALGSVAATSQPLPRSLLSSLLRVRARGRRRDWPLTAHRRGLSRPEPQLPITKEGGHRRVEPDGVVTCGGSCNCPPQRRKEDITVATGRGRRGGDGRLRGETGLVSAWRVEST